VHQFFRVKLRKMPTRGANPPIIRTSGKQAAQRVEKLRKTFSLNYKSAACATAAKVIVISRNF